MYIDISTNNIRIYASRKLTTEEMVTFLYKRYRIIADVVNDKLLFLMSNIDDNKKRILIENGMRLV